MLLPCPPGHLLGGGRRTEGDEQRQSEAEVTLLDGRPVCLGSACRAAHPGSRLGAGQRAGRRAVHGRVWFRLVLPPGFPPRPTPAGRSSPQSPALWSCWFPVPLGFLNLLSSFFPSQWEGRSEGLTRRDYKQKTRLTYSTWWGPCHLQSRQGMRAAPNRQPPGRRLLGRGGPRWRGARRTRPASSEHRLLRPCPWAPLGTGDCGDDSRTEHVPSLPPDRARC